MVTSHHHTFFILLLALSASCSWVETDHDASALSRSMMAVFPSQESAILSAENRIVGGGANFHSTSYPFLALISEAGSGDTGSEIP